MQAAEGTVANVSEHAAAERGRGVLTAAGLFLAFAAVLSLSVGPTGVTLTALPQAISALWGADTGEAARAQLVLLEIRAPRTVLAAFVGMALAVSGAMMQGLFRNPLADPGLIGVSSGAALAAVAVIGLGGTASGPLGIYALPVAAFAGGLATTALLVAVAGRRGILATGTLLLAGIAVAALAGALTGLIAYASDDRQLRDMTLWSLGSLSGASWVKVLAVAPFAAAVALLVPAVTRALNGFLLGEAEAFHLGVDVERAKWVVIAATAAATGAAVAVAGVIGFVGIVAPHLVRLIAGPDHRIVLPAATLLGGALVLTADVVARMIVRPAELPIGIVIAIVGAPLFLHVVLKRGTGGLE